MVGVCAEVEEGIGRLYFAAEGNEGGLLEFEFVASGVRQHDREFELIQRDHLPHKTMSQLICYYYNVWKLRYTAVSVGVTEVLSFGSLRMPQ